MPFFKKIGLYCFEPVCQSVCRKSDGIEMWRTLEPTDLKGGIKVDHYQETSLGDIEVIRSKVKVSVTFKNRVQVMTGEWFNLPSSCFTGNLVMTSSQLLVILGSTGQKGGGHSF